MIPTHRLYISLAIKPAFHLAQNEVVAFLRVSHFNFSPEQRKASQTTYPVAKKASKKKKRRHYTGV